MNLMQIRLNNCLNRLVNLVFAWLRLKCPNVFSLLEFLPCRWVFGVGFLALCVWRSAFGVGLLALGFSRWLLALIVLRWVFGVGLLALDLSCRDFHVRVFGVDLLGCCVDVSC